MRWWDIDGGVLALERELFEEDSWSGELFWSELADPDGRYYLVAEIDGQIVGYAGLSVVADESYVQTLAVAAGHQGRGLGTQLLVELLTRARAGGATLAGLEVRADNARAQRLYARFGFEAVGVRRGYYQPSNADAVVMIADGIDQAAYADLLARSRPGGQPEN
ncbi:MAG: ribosomal protein S18-alanine N-acetyltransferase [Actinomycetota bacterium]